MAMSLTNEERVLLAEIVRMGPVVETVPASVAATVLGIHNLISVKLKTGYGDVKYAELHPTEKGIKSYSKALAAGLVKDPRMCTRCKTVKCPDGCCCAC